jgi:AcrR family transcriptional regulator
VVRSSTTPARPRERGRPRDEAIDEALREAALDLLVEGGARAVTIEAVARRVRTTRAAVYRRFANAEELLQGAMAHADRVATQRQHFEGPYSFEGMEPEAAIRQIMRRAADSLRDPRAASIYFAIAAADFREPRPPEPERFGTLYKQRSMRAMAPMAAVLGVAAELVAELVIGTIVFKTLADGRPPSEEQIETLARVAIAGLRAEAAAQRT